MDRNTPRGTARDQSRVFTNVNEQALANNPGVLTTSPAASSLGLSTTAVNLWGANVDLLGSIDGTLSDLKAIQQEEHSVLSAIKNSIDMQAMASGVSPAALSQARTTMGIPSSIPVMVPVAGFQADPTPAQAPAAPSDPGLPDRTGEGRLRAPDGQATPRVDQPGAPVADHDQGTDTPSGYERYRAARSTSLKDIRTNVARSVSRKASEWQPRRVLQPGSGEGGFDVFDTGTGEAAPATGFQVQELGARNAVLNGARNVLGSMAEGAGPGEALANLAPSVAQGAGYFAAAGFAAKKGLEFAEGQRAQNAQYASVLGGSNAEGFGERINEKLFEIGNWGLMGSGDASKLYSGTLGLYGNDRAGRDAGQQFGTEAYSQMSMSVAESLEVMKAAVRSGNRELVGLADSLKGVTTAARDAGINAEAMRGIYTQQVNTLSPDVGTSSAALAGAFTQGLSNLGSTVTDAGVTPGDLLNDTNFRMATTQGSQFRTPGSVEEAYNSGDKNQIQAATNAIVNGTATRLFIVFSPRYGQLIRNNRDQAIAEYKAVLSVTQRDGKGNPRMDDLQRKLEEKGWFSPNVTGDHVSGILASIGAYQGAPANQAKALATVWLLDNQLLSAISSLDSESISGAMVQGSAKVQEAEDAWDKGDRVDFSKSNGQSYGVEDNESGFTSGTTPGSGRYDKKRGGESADVGRYVRQKNTYGESNVARWLVSQGYNTKRRYAIDGKEVNTGELLDLYYDKLMSDPASIKVIDSKNKDEVGHTLDELSGSDGGAAMKDPEKAKDFESDDIKSKRDALKDAGDKANVAPGETSFGSNGKGNQSQAKVQVQLIPTGGLERFIRTNATYFNSSTNSWESAANTAGIPATGHPGDSDRGHG